MTMEVELGLLWVNLSQATKYQHLVVLQLALYVALVSLVKMVEKILILVILIKLLVLCFHMDDVKDLSSGVQPAPEGICSPRGGGGW